MKAFLAAAAVVLTIAGNATGGDAGPTWSTCGNVTCTTLTVPLEWADPGGPKITIGVARHAALDPSQRVGTLVFATGMGGSALDTLAARYPYFPATLREHFDVVAVGQRGYPHTTLAGTTVLDCGPAPSRYVSSFPTTAGAYDELVAVNRGRYAACRARSGTLVDHVDIDSQARDWEAARRALGADRVSVLTFLQAGMVGQRYASLFPGRVRAMVLDGPVDRTAAFATAAGIGAVTGEQELHRFAAWCATETACELHGHDAAAAYRQLIAQAPVTAPGIDRPFGPDEVAQLLSYFLINGNMTGGGWSDLAATLEAAQHGDMRGLAVMYTASTGAAGYTYAHAFTCLSEPRPTGAFSAHRTAVAAARAIAPGTRGESGPWDHGASCAGWPARDAAGVRTADAPAVIVTTRHDLFSPQPLTAAVARQFTGATVVDNDDDGHIAYLQSPCVQTVVNDYLVSGRPPVPGRVCEPG